MHEGGQEPRLEPPLLLQWPEVPEAEEKCASALSLSLETDIVGDSHVIVIMEASCQGKLGNTCRPPASCGTESYG